MKKEDLTALGLAEDIADRVLAVYAEEIKGFVSASEAEALRAELEQSKSGIAERDKQLSELKKAVGSSENLKAEIEKLQKANADEAARYAAELKHLRIENAVESAIRESKGRNVRAVRALLDIDEGKINVNEDGSLSGLDVSKQLEALAKAEDSSFLFESGTPIKGVLPAPAPASPSGFPENGSYEDMAAYFEANPGISL